MTFVNLPPEFAGLEGRVHWVQQINANEYHSSCPNCGVDENKHSDSHPSDRFVMWIESRMNGRPFGMCVRGCGYKWSPEKSDAVWTEEEKQAFAAKRRELVVKENERIIQYAHDVVMKQQIYIKYWEQLQKSKFGKQYLYDRGFNSDEWNTYWGYGIIEDYKVRGRNSTYYSPAISMPVVGENMTVENVKLRVIDAHDAADRFRNIYKSGNQHLYLPRHEDKIGNKVLLIEGEMKSNMVAMRADVPEDVTIVATQGQGIGARTYYLLEKAEVIYLCLDPENNLPDKNGVIRSWEAARRFGVDRTRIVLSREKVDDAILRGFNFMNAFNMAVKPQYLRA